MGKDLPRLETYLDVYKISDPKQTLYFLKHIEYEHSSMLNAKVKEQKQRKAKSKKKTVMAKKLKGATITFEVTDDGTLKQVGQKQKNSQERTRWSQVNLHEMLIVICRLCLVV